MIQAIVATSQIVKRTHSLMPRDLRPKSFQGDIITTIFGVLIGAMTFGQATPGLQAIGNAREAAYDVFRTLDRVPEIDSSSPEGEKPLVEGQLEFRRVSFISFGFQISLRSVFTTLM